MDTENKQKNRTRVIVVLAIILLVGGIYYFKTHGKAPVGAPGAPAAAAGAGAPPGAPPAMRVEAVKAVVEPVSQKLNVVGSLSSNESVVLSAEISGRVVSIPFKEGTEVKQGTLLFKLDDSVQKASLAQAKANFALAQNNAKRYGDLVKTGAISKVQYEQAEADLSLGTANIALAEANLAKTNIKAPFSGTIGIRQVSVGDVVANGQKLANLEQMSPIRVLFTVPEKYVTELKTKQSILISTEAYPDDKFEAQIFAIDPRIDQNNRSVAVQALAANKDKKLHPGQFVSITMPIKGSVKAVIIPDQALIPSGAGTMVYTVVDGKAKMNPVTIGLRSNSRVEIVSGIQEGDVVITAGYQKIGPGSPVRVSEPTFIKSTPADEEDPNSIKEQ